MTAGAEEPPRGREGLVRGRLSGSVEKKGITA